MRDGFGPLMTARGFRRKGGSFERRERGVLTIATFMRYHDRLRPLFNVRLQVALETFTAELGVILMRDLSNLIGRGSRVDEWQWPVPAVRASALSSELEQALVGHGLPWLESLGNPQQLAAALEAQKYFTPETDAGTAEVMRALGAVATEVYRSPGFLAPRAGKLRPNIVKALSYCYEVSGEWDLAIRAWDEYATVWGDRGQLNERRAFLEARKAGP